MGSSVKPAPFAYHRPGTIAETLALLAHYGDDAKLIAGGQSLTPMLNLRVARTDHLIDINDLADLDHVRDLGDVIEIGALTCHHALARNALIAARLPILAAAADTIGYYAIRQRGTIGGSLAHADPAAQLPLMAILFDAEIVVVGPHGERVVPASAFFQSSLVTDLQPTELIRAVRFPVLRPRECWGFDLFAEREGDFAIASVAATVQIDDDNVVQSMRIALGGVAPVPVALTDVAASGAGLEADAAWCSAVAASVCAALTPDHDPRIPALYRRKLAKTLTERVLQQAITRHEGVLA
jgi:carbon-monoxide dehydrogenase medium subunit